MKHISFLICLTLFLSIVFSSCEKKADQLVQNDTSNFKRHSIHYGKPGVWPDFANPLIPEYPYGYLNMVYQENGKQYFRFNVLVKNTDIFQNYIDLLMQHGWLLEGSLDYGDGNKSAYLRNEDYTLSYNFFIKTEIVTISFNHKSSY